jgi:hypothetical protein
MVRKEETPDSGENERGEEGPEITAAPPETWKGKQEERRADEADECGFAHPASGLRGQEEMEESKEQEERGEAVCVDCGGQNLTIVSEIG